MTVNKIKKYLRKAASSFINKIIYKSTISSPDRLVWINPKEVRYKLIPFFNQWIPDQTSTYVIGGEWDRRYADENKIYPKEYNSQPDERTLFRIQDLDWYRSFRAHFNCGVPWEETELYCRRIEEGFDTSRYDTEEGLRKRLADIERLYRYMNIEGYKTQAELATDDDTPLPAKDWTHEVQINIGRDGELILDDGRNRLIIAQILDIQKIPVRVVVRHEGWQNVRDRLARADSPDNVPKELQKYIQHPDLGDVLTFEPR